MRRAIPVPDMDVDGVIDLNCDPDLSAERHAEARTLLALVFGPYAEAVGRACTQAAANRREVKALLEQVGNTANAVRLRAVVTGIHNGQVRVALGGAERLLPRPDGVALGIGQTVLTDGEGRQVLSTEDYLVGGHTYAFCERLEERYVLVRPLRDSLNDEVRQLALVAECVDLASLVPGDRVLGWSLELGNLVLVNRRLGPLQPAAPDDIGVSRVVTREEIVGLEHVIGATELLFLASADPHYAALLARASRALVGVVFQGPTGCGKSTVAQYFVCLVRQRGGRALYRTASYYLSKWVGEGAGLLRADFAQLDASFEQTGVRPLLVIDELEAIALDRSHPGALAGGHLDVLDTLLDLLTRSHTRMIGISNVANRFLETALTRDGRLHIETFPATLTPEQVSTLVAQTLEGLSLASEETEQ